MGFQLVDHKNPEIMTMRSSNLQDHDHEITNFHDPEKKDHRIMNNAMIS